MKKTNSALLFLLIAVTATVTRAQNTFPATGNAGIGTTAPAVKLDIRNDPVNVPGLNISYTSSARFVRLFGGNLGTGAYNGISTVGDGGIIYGGATGGTALGFIIAPWGGFTGGIRMSGTGVLTASLANNNEGFTVHRAFDDHFIRVHPGNLTTGAYNPITQSGDGGIIFGGTASGTARSFIIAPWSATGSGLRMDGTGRVKIGNVSSMPAGYSLYVDQGILTEKVKIAVSGSAQWADHVFHSNYNLMPLEQVEQFIQQNKHLPNVPSADEMVKEGNDLGKTDAKLLEKIEELTLYLIEMKKNHELKTEQQQAETDILKKQLKELKNKN